MTDTIIPQTEVCMSEARVLMGAKGIRTAANPDWGEPVGVNAGGFDEYDDVMCCHDCPMLVRYDIGALLQACSLTSRSVFDYQPCTFGITKRGRGLTQEDFERRDEAIERSRERDRERESVTGRSLGARRNEHAVEDDEIRARSPRIGDHPSLSDLAVKCGGTVESYIDHLGRLRDRAVL